MPRNLNCVVCNELVDVLQGGGFSVFMSFPVKPEGPHQRPPCYVVHEDCARRLAHQEFDWQHDAMGRENTSAPE